MSWIQGQPVYYDAGVYQNAYNASWFLLGPYTQLGGFSLIYSALKLFEDANISVAYVKLIRNVLSDYR